MNWFPGFGLVNSSAASVFTETRVVATLSTVIVCPTLATWLVVVVLVEDVDGDEVMVPVVVFLAAVPIRAKMPIQAKSSTAMIPSAIQSPVLLCFFGGTGGGA